MTKEEIKKNIETLFGYTRGVPEKSIILNDRIIIDKLINLFEPYLSPQPKDNIYTKMGTQNPTGRYGMSQPKSLEGVKEEIRFYLDNLVLEIGRQVTRDYQYKNGIWEGMSLSNTKTVNLYAKKFNEFISQQISNAEEREREKVLDSLWDIIQSHDCDLETDCCLEDRLIEFYDSLSHKSTKEEVNK